MRRPSDRRKLLFWTLLRRTNTLNRSSNKKISWSSKWNKNMKLKSLNMFAWVKSTTIALLLYNWRSSNLKNKLLFSRMKILDKLWLSKIVIASSRKKNSWSRLFVNRWKAKYLWRSSYINKRWKHSAENTAILLASMLS